MPWKKYNFRYYNYLLILFALILSVIGVLCIRSATSQSYYYSGIENKQILGIVLGVILMLILSLLDYHLLLKFWPVLYIGNFLLLLAVRFFGEVRGGAKRWITLPLIGNLQPSEFLKITLIISLAAVLGYLKDRLNTLPGLMAIVALLFPPLYMVVTQPNLSTTVLIALICLSVIYVAGISYKIVGGVLLAGIPFSIWFIYTIMQPGQTLIYEYQARRILSFINPEKYQDSVYQQENSVMAIGSGGLWGKGLNTTTFESVKSGNFISESHSDFIFTIIGEELGFVGSVAVLLLLAGVVYQCLRIAKNARDAQGRYIAMGVVAMIGFQTFINVAVATFIMPNTGLPLPFVSYGVSSLMSNFITLGVVLNIGLQRRNRKKNTFFID